MREEDPNAGLLPAITVEAHAGWWWFGWHYKSRSSQA